MPFRPPLAPRAAAIATVLAVALGSTAGCGKSKSSSGAASSTAVVAKNVGLAAGTARQKLFSPSVEAALKKGAPNHKQALGDAGTASEYVVRALASAQKAAAKDPKLKPLAAKLQAAGSSIGALTVVLRSGKTPPKSLLTGCLSTINAVEDAVHDAGITVKEQVATNLAAT